MIDITDIVSAVVGLICALITAFVIPWIRSKTTAEQQKTINDIVSIAVQGAEMLYKGSGRGAEKKQHVIDYLNQHGIILDEDTLNHYIEAAVLKLKNGVL